MAFFPTEYLEEGKVDFLDHMTHYDIKRTILDVRKSPKRKKIIDGFLPKKDEIDPFFIFEIVYDIEEYKDITKELITKWNIDLSKEKLIVMLNNTSLGFEILTDNFDNILLKFQKGPEFIFDYVLKHSVKCKELLAKLRTYSNLHIRSLFMSYLIQNEKSKFDLIYDDIRKYLTSVNYDENEQLTFLPELMDVEDVSRIAIDLLMARKISQFKLLKEYIFKNYPSNNLAELLLCGNLDPITFQIVSNNRGIKEFESDADRYFKTASTWRLNILKNHSKNVSKELLESFKKYLLYFKNNGELDPLFEHLDIYGLTRLLEQYVDKYMSISKEKTHGFLDEGSTASCYRIGDFTFKLVKTKWSYENVICPNLYLILPNLEEIFIRNEVGIVEAGIEVQKYLKRDAKNVPEVIFKYFNDELKRLGYYSTDSLINGQCGDNTRLLDSYTEAGIEVPDWFKEYPLVLVDRDRVYKLDNRKPKQRPGNNY